MFPGDVLFEFREFLDDGFKVFANGLVLAQIGLDPLQLGLSFGDGIAQMSSNLFQGGDRGARVGRRENLQL